MLTWLGRQSAVSPALLSQPCLTQYCRGLGSLATRARRFSMAMMLVPSGPGTATLWWRDSLASAKIFPPLRMMTRSATALPHRAVNSQPTSAVAAHSMSQSPLLKYLLWPAPGGASAPAAGRGNNRPAFPQNPPSGAPRRGGGAG